MSNHNGETLDINRVIEKMCKVAVDLSDIADELRRLIVRLTEDKRSGHDNPLSK